MLCNLDSQAYQYLFLSHHMLSIFLPKGQIHFKALLFTCSCLYIKLKFAMCSTIGLIKFKKINNWGKVNGAQHNGGVATFGPRDPGSDPGWSTVIKFKLIFVQRDMQ